MNNLPIQQLKEYVMLTYLHVGINVKLMVNNLHTQCNCDSFRKFHCSQSILPISLPVDKYMYDRELLISFTLPVFDV